MSFNLDYVFGSPASLEETLRLRKDSAANHIDELASTAYSEYDEHQRGWLEGADIATKEQICDSAAEQDPPNKEVLLALAGIVSAQHREKASCVRKTRTSDATSLDETFVAVRNLKGLETYILATIRGLNREESSDLTASYIGSSPSVNHEEGCFILY